jgi:acyl carrier protein
MTSVVTTTAGITLDQVSDVVLAVAPGLDAPIDPAARLGADLGVDSLSIVDIVVKIEQVFGITIDDSEFDRFQSVQDIFHLVQQRQ